MGFIGVQPASVPLTASDIEADIINSTHIGDTAISGFTALAETPADTDEFLISDGGVLKRIDASFVGGGVTGISSSSSSTAINIDSSGHVTMPLQTAFLTHLDNTQDVNSTNTTEINFNTEIFDLNADYNTSTKRFTAPVTGKYMLHAMARVVNADSNSGGHYVQTQIVTSNRTYTVITGINLTYWNINNSVLADMDANDTAYVQIKSSNDTSWAVSGYANDTRFFGYLVA